MSKRRTMAWGFMAASSAFIWGCASEPRISSSSAAAAAAAAAASAASGERSARGNPPFYEVLGQRYYVRSTADGFIEHGTASWYGKDFHRLPTSSGEPYDMYAMTAAHKTLPLPTWVEVTNLENNRRVIVKVNDRGPFVGDRVIDLSFAAAEAIDMVTAGTARVEVRALGTSPSGTAALADNRVGATAGATTLPAAALPAASAPRAATAAPAATAAAGPMMALTEALFIQVGAFSDRTNAQRLVEDLRGTGFANAFVVSDASDTLHRVRVGPFDTVDDYDRATDGLRRRGVRDTRLVVGP